MAFAAGIMRRHHVHLGSAALLTALAWPFARAQKPKLEHVPCTARFGQFDAQTAPIARCGTITVPQDRAAPNALTSSPSCFRSWCTPGQGAGYPVLFLDGGPGSRRSPRCSKCCFKRRSASYCFGSGASSPSTAAEYRPTNTARRRTWALSTTRSGIRADRRSRCSATACRLRRGATHPGCSTAQLHHVGRGRRHR